MTAADKPSLFALFAAPVPIQVGALTLQIKPLGWYEGSAAIEPLVDLVPALPPITGTRDDLVRLVPFILTWRDEFAQFAAAASGLDLEEIKQLPPGPFAELVWGVAQVNMDFFASSLSRLLPQVKSKIAEAQGGVSAVTAVAGSDSMTSSNGSSSTATA